MKSDRWRRIEEIVQAAAVLEGDAREAFLTNACSGDASLRAQVDALLTDGTAEGSQSPILSTSTTEPGDPAVWRPAANVIESLIGSDPVAAQALAHFRILERIGVGGMGLVYRARDEKLDRDVALKVLPTALPRGAPARRRFHREARALSRLDHPNVATVYDFVIGDQGDVLVMEYVPGVTLSDRLRSGTLTEAEVTEIGIQLAAGLHAAHERGVIHRDLKPGNLRLTPDGRLKILDFGLASLLERATDDLTNVTESLWPAGTLPYLAPELLGGSAPAVTSDIYSAGVTLYELATGRLPFPGPRAVLIDQILNASPQRPREASPALSTEFDAIVVKAIEKQPDRRYQSAEALMADLQRSPTQSAVIEPSRARTFVTRRAAIAAALVFAMAASMWFVFRPARPAAFAPRGWALIADFDNRSGNPTLDKTVQESLSIALQQSAHVNVFSREQLFDALRRMTRPSVSTVTEDVALEVCRREGVQVLLAGSVVSSGDIVRIVVRALESSEARLMFAEQVEFTRPEELFGAIDTLARRVRERLGESMAGIQKASEPLDKVTTPSLEALRRYSEAVDAFARGEVKSAIELLQAALVLDPDFAMAHRALSRAYGMLGNREQEVQHISRAYERRNSVTTRERHLIEAFYHGVRERYDEAAEAYSVLVALYPDDANASFELSVARHEIGDITGAIDAIQQELRLRPRSRRAHEQLVLLLAENNAPSDALSIYQRAVATVGPSLLLHWGAGLAHFGLGDLAEARREFNALEPNAAFWNIGLLYLTRVDLYEGSLRKAAEQLAVDIAEDSQFKRTSAELTRRYLLGRAWLLLGQQANARLEGDRIAEAQLADAKAVDLRGAGILYASAGDLAAARRVLARLESVARDQPSSSARSCLYQIRGEIALAEKRRSDALTDFRSAESEYDFNLSHRGLARAYESLGDIPLAIEEWKHVVAAKGQILRDGFPPDWTLAHLELARLLEKSGARLEAREHAETFLQIWRQSDAPALRPQAEQLRRRL